MPSLNLRLQLERQAASAGQSMKVSLERHLRNFWGSVVLRVFPVAAFVLVSATTSALAAQSVIDSITVKFRDDVAPTSAALSDASRAELYDALQMHFVQVGGTRDGAFRLELTKPVPLDDARAAVNRVRMLSQVLYANIRETESAAAVGNMEANKADQGPPVRRMIVKYRDAAISRAAQNNEDLPAALLDRLSGFAGQAIAHERAMSGGAYVVRMFRALPVDQAASLAQYLETDPAIDYAEPDLLKQPALTPNDPNYSLQWHYQSPPAEMGGVNLPPAWNITTGSTGVVVGVIDTGILPHPDLIGRYLAGYDMISDPLVANDHDPPSCTVPGSCSSRDADASDPGDWITASENASGYFQGCGQSNSSFHGTHVSGTIGAATNNGTGVAGINWVSKVLPVRVLGKCGGYTSDIADAMVWASGGSVPGVPANPNPARVLNLSLGGSGACDATTQNAINSALAAGAVVVVAAGNSNADARNYSPAGCNGVITVAATGRQGQRASYSNFGPAVEISAPGGSDGQGVLSTLNNGATSPQPNGYTYVYYQGTSMATPHVAGIASLMLSVNPSLTPAQVLAKIQSTARAFPTGTGRDCTTSLCGAGIVDAGAAAASAGPPPSTTLTASPASIAAGGTLSASWSGISTPTATDWIGLYVPGAPSGNYIDWIYVSCSKTPSGPVAAGSCPFVLPNVPTGTYELRLLANNGFTVLATSNAFTVTGSTSLNVTPTSIAAGGTLSASWSGISTPTATDWIGLYVPGAPSGNYIDWIYVSCSKTPSGPVAAGSCPFRVPNVAPGTYELRLFANNGFSVLAISNAVTVTP